MNAPRIALARHSSPMAVVASRAAFPPAALLNESVPGATWTKGGGVRSVGAATVALGMIGLLRGDTARNGRRTQENSKLAPDVAPRIFETARISWSGREDLNLRPLAPHATNPVLSFR